MKSLILKPVNAINSEFWDSFPESISEFDIKVREGVWFDLPSKLESKKDYPPTPPLGYYWQIDHGEHLSSNIKYRLWNDKLGYFPGSG